MLATLSELAREGVIEAERGRQKAIADLGINPEKPNPAESSPDPARVQKA